MTEREKIKMKENNKRFDHSHALTTTILPSDIYTDVEIKAPEGFELGKFDVIELGEWFLDANGEADKLFTVYKPTAPRFHLIKTPLPFNQRYELADGKQPRPLVAGDAFVGPTDDKGDQKIQRWGGDIPSFYNYFILKAIDHK